jgi:hypothetical protein
VVIIAGTAAWCRADTVVGVFSDPQLTGSLVALDGTNQFMDNTSTAFYSIVNSTTPALPGATQQSTGSALTWGANPGSSTIVFTGKTVPSDPYQTFDLGTITFNNGTSDLNSLIFGAKLTLYATPNGTISSSQPNGDSTLSIVTTANLGLGGTEQHDADFVTLSGIANQSFNVLEGAGATAELYGKFVDDPTIVLTSIVLNPGQDNVAFIGNGQPVPVPETSSLLVGAGIFGLIGFEWLRQRRFRREVA